VDVFDQPQPGHLHCVERVSFLQPKRPHRRGYDRAIPEHQFLPSRQVAVAGSQEQVSIVSWVVRHTCRHALMLRSTIDNPLGDLRRSASTEAARPG
jgi:hypothetical protein